MEAGIMIVLINLTIDILYAYIDPRIRLDQIGHRWSPCIASRPVLPRRVLRRASVRLSAARGCGCARDLPIVPLAILVPFVLIAVFANFVAPYDPTEPIPGAKIFEPPFWMAGGNPHALLGTDFQGRDVLSRLIFGARVSLIVGVTRDDRRRQHRHRRSASSPAISAAGSTR